MIIKNVELETVCGITSKLPDSEQKGIGKNVITAGKDSDYKFL